MSGFNTTVYDIAVMPNNDGLLVTDQAPGLQKISHGLNEIKDTKSLVQLLLVICITPGEHVHQKTFVEFKCIRRMLHR